MHSIACADFLLLLLLLLLVLLLLVLLLDVRFELRHFDVIFCLYLMRSFRLDIGGDQERK